MARINLGKVVPEKGVDYYTEEDKQEIIEQVEQDLDMSDIRQDIENIKTEQTTQNENIQSNYNEINEINQALEGDYVKNTDYATTDKGGTIKTSPTYMATSTTAGGALQASIKTYEQYQSGGTGMFIGKGTLENVIAGKDLTTKAYVDGLVGDIESILHTLNTGSGV